MKVVAGRAGSFFVVKMSTDDNIIQMLSELTFEEFIKYNAYETMKKISNKNSNNYAAKNLLRRDVLDNFVNIEEAVYHRLTQDLIHFIEFDDGRERSEGFDNDIVIDPSKFQNGFAIAAPREVSGIITDSFQIKEKDVPEMMKRVGISFKRELLSSIVKWNNITYRVDIVPSSPIKYQGALDNKAITIVEYCYMFQADDWRKLKKIEFKLLKEKKKQSSWWWPLKLKTDAELIVKILDHLYGKEKAKLAKFTRMYETYKELQKLRHDYRDVIIHEFHHLRTRIALENHRLKLRSKSLKARDMYNILVEDERSAALATTIDRINRYWQNKNWNDLLAKEPCFNILANRSEAERHRLLKNMDFVLNAKLKIWNEEKFEGYSKRFITKLPALEAQNSYAKGEDVDGKEYLKQLSMMYSHYVYDPDLKKNVIKSLSHFIKVPVPINEYVQKNIIDRAQYYIDRKKSSMNFLMTKHGISKEIILQAARIYDNYRRIKRAKGSVKR